MAKQKFYIKLDLGYGEASFGQWEEYTEKQAWAYMRAWGKRCLRLGLHGVPAWKMVEVK